MDSGGVFSGVEQVNQQCTLDSTYWFKNFRVVHSMHFVTSIGCGDCGHSNTMLIRITYFLLLMGCSTDPLLCIASVHVQVYRDQPGSTCMCRVH